MKVTSQNTNVLNDKNFVQWFENLSEIQAKKFSGKSWMFVQDVFNTYDKISNFVKHIKSNK